MSANKALTPGIYFGLAEEIYHADPALSRGDMVSLLDTPNTYWSQSWMNPGRKKKKTNDGMEYGSAFDCLMFEPQVFKRRYQVVPIDEWGENKIKISYEDYFKIVESIKILRAGQHSSLFLSGGMPQVTIVFDDNGVRYRTRHDYFTPVLSTDFKTSRGLQEGLLKRSFSDYGYDIQFALYKRSRERFKQQLRAGEAGVFGKVDKKFLDAFMSSESNGFIFVFQRSSPPFPFLPLMPEDDTEDSGKGKIYEATRIYQKYMSSHGVKEWPVCEGTVKPFSMFYGIRSY